MKSKKTTTAAKKKPGPRKTPRSFRGPVGKWRSKDGRLFTIAKMDMMHLESVLIMLHYTTRRVRTMQRRLALWKDDEKKRREIRAEIQRRRKKSK